MNASDDRSKAYSFGLQPDQAAGYLQIGWKTVKVAVTHYSWSGYTLVVDRATARRCAKGTRGTLEYQGSRYPIRCLDCHKLSHRHFEVRLELEPDKSSATSLHKKKHVATGLKIRLNERDPILSVAACLGVVLVMLILPGWGEKWGTSGYLSDGFRSIVVNTCEACKSMLVR